uniref:Uncharacterized protein n=1 Tax=Rhizophora mucronata TaxID=61149 RepID=A0A2P2QCP2_RHIMU
MASALYLMLANRTIIELLLHNRNQIEIMSTLVHFSFSSSFFSFSPC